MIDRVDLVQHLAGAPPASLTIGVRPMRESDRSYVFKSWLSSYHALYTIVPWDTFMPRHREIIEGLLSRPATKTLIACDVIDQNVILGFACGSPSERFFHWAYTKNAYRSYGIARELIERVMRDVPLDFAAKPQTVYVTHSLPSYLAPKVERQGWRVRPGLATYVAADASAADWKHDKVRSLAREESYVPSGQGVIRARR